MPDCALRRRTDRRRESVWLFAAADTAFHLRTSPVTKALACSGVMTIGSTAMVARRAAQAGSARILAVAARSRACTALGVLAGVPMPHQVLDTTPDMPSSAKVG